MKVWLVDDERLALVQLERMLRAEVNSIEIMMFQDVMKMFEYIKQEQYEQPDAVFMDIHMPSMSGLQAAEQLQDLIENTDIIFVTAYDEYAVQAFELNAIDYLLKPLSKQRLAKTVDRILKRLSLMRLQPSEPSANASLPKIFAFKAIRFQSPNQPAVHPKWRTAKAQELFAYLFHRRDEIVHKSTLLELLSPELDKKRAMTQLYTAIYQIRQCLQQMNIDLPISNASIQEGYVLRTDSAIIDIDEWERRLSEIDGDAETHHAELDKLLAEYEGDYLEDYDYVWAENERERLRQLWLQHARLLSGYLLRAGKLLDALQWYERIQEKDPYNEEETLIMIKLYDQLKQYDKVVLFYERLEKEFIEELGLGIPKEVSQWYEQWQRTKKTALQ